MNEWSPGGNHSNPRTPNQTGTSLRPHKEDSENGGKLSGTKLKAVSENRSHTCYDNPVQDVSTTSLGPSIKKGGGGNGISDPRFKRVISSGVQNDVCVGTELKNSKLNLMKTESRGGKLSPKNSKKSHGDSNTNLGKFKSKPKHRDEVMCKNGHALEECLCDYSKDHLKGVDDLNFNHELVGKASDYSACTLNTRNTSLESNGQLDEFPNTVTKVPSATRLKKVQKWIHDQASKPEKKHSVITVIGQMQEPETLSSALREIDRRRKLVKELDRYAVCRKLVDTEKEKEISDIISKIESLKNSKINLFNNSNDTLSTDVYSTKADDDVIVKSSNSTDFDNKFKCCKEKNIDSTTSKNGVSESEFNLKYQEFGECLLKGKIRTVFSELSYQKMLCIVMAVSGVLSCIALFLIQTGALVSVDLFNSKPKTVTWYEKIFNWLWELFKPAANYRRTKSWPSY